MRLGFIGVGRHGQKMAAAFRECGATLAAYDREHPHGDWVIDGKRVRDNLRTATMSWGEAKYVPWHDMIASSAIDAIVCCAPPDVTAEVTLAAANAGKPVCATKPLRWPTAEGADEARGVWVDLWRLSSPAWLALKADLQGREIRSVDIDFYGSGPVRATHSGLLDYGPHALGFVLDLGLRPELTWTKEQKGCWFGKGDRVGVTTGNGFGSAMMYVRVEATDGESRVWCESQDNRHRFIGDDQGELLNCDRLLALRNFCRAFLAGEPSDTLRISCEAMRLLRQAEPW